MITDMITADHAILRADTPFSVGTVIIAADFWLITDLIDNRVFTAKGK